MPDGGGHPCATVSQKKHGSPGLFQQLLGLLIVAFELAVVGVEPNRLPEIFDCLFELASTSEHGAEIVKCIRIGRINLYGSLEMLDGKVCLVLVEIDIAEIGDGLAELRVDVYGSLKQLSGYVKPAHTGQRCPEVVIGLSKLVIRLDRFLVVTSSGSLISPSRPNISHGVVSSRIIWVEFQRFGCGLACLINLHLSQV